MKVTLIIPDDLVKEILTITKAKNINEAIIIALNSYVSMEKLKEKEVGYTTDGKPLTRQQYNERLLVAEKQIRSGDYITQEDLEKEIEN